MDAVVGETLTPRQTEVLRRTHDGQRDWEIAEALRIKIGSVRNIKQAIRRVTAGPVTVPGAPGCRECRRLAEEVRQLESAVAVWRAVAEEYERRLMTFMTLPEEGRR